MSLHSAQHRIHPGLNAALRRERARALLTTAQSGGWVAMSVGSGGTVTLYPLINFTKDANGNTQGVLLLAIENSISPFAATPQQLRALSGAAPAVAPLNQILQAVLTWAIYNVAGQGATTVTATNLAALNYQLAPDYPGGDPFDYATLEAFFTDSNIVFEIVEPPASSPTLGVTVFPIVPELTLTTNDPTSPANVNFTTFNQITPAVQQQMQDYFDELEVKYEQFVGNSPGSSTGSQLAVDNTPVSIATILFEQYFKMLASATVKAASDLLNEYPFETVQPASLSDVIDACSGVTPAQVLTPNQGTTGLLNVGTSITLTNVSYQARSSDTVATIAKNFGTSPALLLDNNASAAVFNANTAVSVSGLTYNSLQGETLNLIATRLLLRTAPSAVFGQIQGIADFLQQLPGLNPQAGLFVSLQPVFDPGTQQTVITSSTTTLANLATDLGGLSNQQLMADIAGQEGLLAPGQTWTLPGAQTYTTVEGDTLNLIAGYVLGQQQGVVQLGPYMVELLKNFPVGTDPSQPLTPKTSVALPPFTYNTRPGDTVQTIATTLLTSPEFIEPVLGAVTNILAPLSVLAIPEITYPIAAGDTILSIAQEYNLTLEQLADNLLGETPIFAANRTVMVNDVESIAVDDLLAALLNQGEWNNIAGMVSRFLLSGLRLPDPNNLSSGDTLPLYVETGQQFPVTATSNAPPTGFQVTLTNPGTATWVTLSPAPLALTLSADQVQLFTNVASGAFTAQPVYAAMPLFQDAPVQFSLKQHYAWQAAETPTGIALSSTGGPSIWTFPDALLSQIATNAGASYEVVAGRQQSATTPMTTTPVNSSMWATMIAVSLALPPAGAPAASVANLAIVQGADSAGQALLQQVFQYLDSNPNVSSSTYVLYVPNAAGATPGGLVSDSIDASLTFVLKTNLSTLTHAGPTAAVALLSVPAAGTGVYGATIDPSDTASFLQLIWECSVVQSGGFYLNYVNASSGAGLPPSVFSQGGGEIYLLVLTASATPSGGSPILPFHNCVIVGDNIDASSTNVLIQAATANAPGMVQRVAVVPPGSVGFEVSRPNPDPADTYTTAGGDTLTTVATNVSTALGITLQPVDVANQIALEPVLLTGVSLTVPPSVGGATTYPIASGDTLQSIASKFAITVPALVGLGTNATTAILQSPVPLTISTPYQDLTADQTVDSLFQLLGYSIAAGGGFVQSGLGLPQGP